MMWTREVAAEAASLIRAAELPLLDGFRTEASKLDAGEQRAFVLGCAEGVRRLRVDVERLLGVAGDAS